MERDEGLACPDRRGSFRGSAAEPDRRRVVMARRHATRRGIDLTTYPVWTIAFFDGSPWR
jgi:hypothetical protein